MKCVRVNTAVCVHALYLSPHAEVIIKSDAALVNPKNVCRISFTQFTKKKYSLNSAGNVIVTVSWIKLQYMNK